MSQYNVLLNKVFSLCYFNSFFLVILALLSLSFSPGAYAASAIGIAKEGQSSGRIITYTFYIENIGDDLISDLTLPDNLDSVFGAGNYSLLSAPSFIVNPGTVNLNSGFDGSGDTALFNAGSSLIVGAAASFDIQIEITTPADLGSGLGVYSNQVTVNGLDSSESVVTDLSDSGTAPDPNANGDAGDENEDDPTVISLFENPVIGLAKRVSLSGTQLTFDFFVENFGNVTLSSISLTDDLDSVLGAGNYSIVSAPAFVDDPGTITLNAGFDGSADPNLISSGTLVLGDTAQIQLVVDVITVSDQGSGPGVYTNQAEVSALSPTGVSISDLSANGNEPDPSLSGEDDPTPIVIGEEPRVGLAIDASVSGDDITIDFYLENLGNAVLDSFTLNQHLDEIFGSGNYTISSAPALVIDPGSLVLDGSYNGSSVTSLISSGNLAAGVQAQIRLVVSLNVLSDQGSGTGNYSIQSIVAATAPSDASTSDISDDGVDPDPNGDGNPDEAGENDPTLVTVAERPSIGMALEVIHDSATTKRFRYKVENLGNVTLTNMLLDNNLDSVLGAGNYVVTGRNLIDNPGGISINTTYNGSSSVNLIESSSSLNPLQSFIVESSVFIITVVDQGSGLGEYQTQTSISADSPSAATVSDLSDSGSVPDTNGNGTADDAGEDDPTLFSMLTRLGIALDANVVNNQVTFDFYLEAFASNITDISLSNNLDPILGTGNYVISSAPVLLDDPGTITLNTAFDGSADDSLITTGTLAAGVTAQIRIVVDISNVINSNSNGFGNYENQVTVYGVSAAGDNLSDLSHTGTDSDPGDDGDPTNEGTATSFTIPVDFVTGSALNASVTDSVITLDFYLENFGGSTAQNLALDLNMDDVFGAGNYVITATQSFIDDPGTIILNGAYDGSTDSNLLAAGSSLASLDTAQIQLQVTVTSITNSQNLGIGVYELQSTSSTTDSTGVSMSDLSNDGVDADASDSDGDPTDPGLADPFVAGDNEVTRIFVGSASIGIAESVSVSGTVLTYNIFIENLGSVDLTSVSLVKLLDSVYGAGNYTVTSVASVAGSLNVNTSFNGTFFQATLIFSGSLAAGETAQVAFTVDVTNETDQGHGVGVYHSQSTVNAIDPLGASVTDISDMGTEPDADGDGSANEAGENDVTIAVIGEEVAIGVSKTASVIGQQVTFDIYLENLGNTNLSGLTLTEDLDTLFGSGNYSINTTPVLIDDPGTITLNAGFDGALETSLFNSQALNLSDTAHLRFVIDVTAVVDTGNGLGSYSTQSSISGESALGSTASDISDAGTDPDPDGDGNSNEAGENDATSFSINVVEAGVALNVTSSNGQVTFDYYLENFGSVTASGLSLNNALDSVFGAGNWSLNTGPSLISVERDVVVNPLFDGITDLSLLSGSLDPGHTAQVQIVVDVDTLTDQGAGLGVYNNQVALTGDDGISDLSDDGTDPDPNGNGLPDDAGEDDASTFTLSKIETTSTLIVSNMTAVNGESVTFTVSVSDAASNPASGDIEIKVDSVIVSSQTLNASGQATYANSYEFADNPDVTVEFLENVNFNTSSDNLVLTVGQAATTTTIDSSSVNPTTTDVPTIIGFSVDIDAPGTGLLSGTVTVSDGVNNCFSVVSGVNSASSSCNLSLETAGSRTLNATFVPDVGYLTGSVSANFSQTVDNTAATISIDDTTPDQGQLLTANVSDIDGVSGVVSYQWNRGATVVSTAQTYTPVQADVNQTLIVSASFTDDGGTTEAPVSAVTSEVSNVNDAGSVSIDETVPAQGQTLTATVADPDGATGTISYQWQSGSTNVGSDSAMYTTTQSDVNQAITVKATYTDDLGTAEAPVSAATATVSNVNDTGNVSIDNTTPSQGQILTASVTDPDGATGVISYQWKRGDINVGSDSASYTTTQSDVSKTITVSATYTDDLASPEAVVSPATAAVMNVNDIPTGQPVIIGELLRNETLSVDTSTIDDADGLGDFSYQWRRSSSPISGANSSMYVPGESEVGFTLSVTISYVDGAGAPESVTSPETATISDLDSDGDGIFDLEEGTGDSDGDGTPDFLDDDSDNDGISDSEEGNDDSDGDGIADYLDTSPDEDGDGIPDILEGGADTDTDGDGITDAFDTDSDNDGVSDFEESGATGLDSDGDGIDDAFDVDSTGGVDADGDGIDDDVSPVDTDGDGIPDYLDRDSDNDSVPDTLENREAPAKKATSSTALKVILVLLDTDGDGVKDYLDSDSDEDGISDKAEAATTFVDSDLDQIIDEFDVDFTGGLDENLDGVDDAVVLQNSDNDTTPDMFDLDADNDGINDVIEAGLSDADFDGIVDSPAELTDTPVDSDMDDLPDYRDLDSNDDGIFDIQNSGAKNLDLDNDGQIDDVFASEDSDGDGIVDFMDEEPGQFGTSPDRDLDGIPSRIDIDDDGDGISDTLESPLDTDNDGIIGSLDTDSDGDSISDTEEQLLVALLHIDSDFDGLDDAVDVDSTGGVDADGDGQDDSTFSTVDLDGDGLLAFLDTDTDGDGVLDADENGDFNNDGINDRLQIKEEKRNKSGSGSFSIAWLTLLLLVLSLCRKTVAVKWRLFY